MKLFILCQCFTLSLSGFHYYDYKLWDKPCVDDDSIPSPGKSAEEVIRYSEWILEQLGLYKDIFIEKLEKHHATFDEVAQIAKLEKKEWLRNFNWYTEEILPHNKLLGEQLPENTIEKLKEKINYVHYKVMTKINAALYFIIGTIFEITVLPAIVDVLDIDLDFKRTIKESMRIITSIICSMNNYMKSKNYQIEIPLEESLPKNLTYSEVGLVLLDTFNFFEYIKQLFEALKFEEYVKTELPHESELWANPCNYSPPPSYYFNKSLGQNSWTPDPEKARELAPKIATHAMVTFNDGIKFRNEYAQVLTNYPTFNEILEDRLQTEWLKKYSWYRDEVLPERKQLFNEIEYSYLSKHLMKVFPKVLPFIHKGAKMILSGLDRIYNQKVYKKGLLPDFQSKFVVYINKVQHLLCLLSDFVRARGQEQLWLFTETRISELWIFPIYRDSLVYLSYIGEVFEYISRYQASGLDPYVTVEK